MQALIWRKVNDIIIGNNTLKIEIVPHDGNTATSEWTKLTDIVNNPNASDKLFFIEGLMALGQGYNNYDWATYWTTEVAGISSNAMSYNNEGNIGYVYDYNEKILGHYLKMTPPSTGLEYVEHTSYSSNGEHMAYLEPYWNIENESVYVDIPFFVGSIDTVGGVKRIRYTSSAKNNTIWSTLNNGLGDLAINEDAPFYDENQTQEYEERYINLYQIQTEVLIHLNLAIGYVSDGVGSRQFTIGAGKHIGSANKSYAFLPYPAPVLQAPTYDFSLSITGLSNLQLFVQTGETAEGIFTVESNADFNGTFNVYAFDYEDDLTSFNDMLQASLDEEDAAQYGTIEYNETSYTISAGESVEVTITYTSTQISSQTDSYSIIVIMTSLDS